MPELRVDPLSGGKVLVAGERGGRPGAWLRVEPRPAIDPAEDPFLEGHEERTPPELYARRGGGGAPDSPGWQVRVVTNLYPALAPAGEQTGPDPVRSPGETSHTYTVNVRKANDEAPIATIQVPPNAGVRRP